jgi:hypothetical protein
MNPTPAVVKSRSASVAIFLPRDPPSDPALRKFSSLFRFFDFKVITRLDSVLIGLQKGDGIFVLQIAMVCQRAGKGRRETRHVPCLTIKTLPMRNMVCY